VRESEQMNITAPATLTHRLAPLAAAVLAVAVFSLMDALMKKVSLETGAANAAFWRSVFCVPLAALFYFLWRGRWPERQTWNIHISRAAISAIMVVVFFYGITKVPLAEGIALTFIAPLIAIYFASFFMGEAINRTALIGSLTGFAGVLVMIAGRGRSGDPYTMDVWLGIGAMIFTAILYAGNIVLMRKQSFIARPVEVVFVQTLLVLLFLGVPAPFYATLPNAEQAGLLIAGAGCTVIALLLFSWAYGRTEVQYLVPVEYTAFPWATFFGFVMFAEKVTGVVLVGTIFIVAGCLIATWKRAD
jgi:S-adenosylmethionine uptake transporter